VSVCGKVAVEENQRSMNRAPGIVEDEEAAGPPAGRDPARPDVLYLAHRFPFPPDKGDRIRTFHVLRSLAKRATVHLACLADEPPADEAIAALRAYCGRVAVVRLDPWSRWIRTVASLALGRTATEGAFQSPALGATVRRWARQTPFRAALASASSMVPYLRLAELRDLPAVIDLVDVDSQKWLDYARVDRGPKAWLYRTEGRRLRRLERGLPDWARAVTVVSEAEAALYRAFGPSDRVHAITNGVDLEAFRPVPGTAEGGVVFVGALDYRPNVDGACWFCQEVWPEIRRRHPQATISLVGRRPSPEVRRLGREPGVEVVGQVPDVRPYLAGAAVAVVPLRIARGVQNKVLEALAMGKAVVASPPALEGLPAEPGVHALMASTPAEWADQVSRLLDDECLRRQFGSAGRRYVEEHHRWETCLEPFGNLLGLPRASAPADLSCALAVGNKLP
jgi:sugar transferase (PEP-CTERM/EpsH1 system associated)